MNETIGAMEERQRALREELAEIYELRLGSLFHRTRKCGKANCACAGVDHPGHGCWVVEKRVGKSNVMSTIAERNREMVQRQLAEGQRYWKLCAELAEVTDNLTREKLRGNVEPQSVKKNSKRTLTGKSPAK